MMKAFILGLLFTTQLFAQTFVTEKSVTDLSFNGTFLTEARNPSAVITVRKQSLLIVMEVRDFMFHDDLQTEEFNELFMESHYFPQIRISGSFRENIDLTQDAIYVLMVPVKMTMRGQTRSFEMKTRMEITAGTMTFSFDKKILLSDFQVPYAGQGSQIGHEARMKFHADLKRTH